MGDRGGATVLDDGGSTDGGSLDAEAELPEVGPVEDGGAPDQGLQSDVGPAPVPIFVAQGMVGRTTVSCDDGRTWGYERSWDVEGDPHLCGSTAPVTCYASGSSCSYVGYDGTCEVSPDCDCGHSPGFGKGVVFGDGAFVATWGWGHPGSVRRSVDGITWASTLEDDQFGGLAYGGGRYVLASRTPRWSTDGIHWNDSAEADFREPDGTTIWSVRRFAYADVLGGRFVAVASGNNDRDLLISSDGGETWWRPNDLPGDCAGEVSTYGGIVAGDGVIVIVDSGATACRSTDGGATWTTTRIGPTNIYSHGVWTGRAFWFWGDDGQRYESPDGLSWSATPMITPHRIGPVALSPQGTLVAVANVWEGYADQTFLRSDDGGLTWEVLDAQAFHPGHPIFSLTFGWADPATACR